MEPGRANPRCVPSASPCWACLPASGGKDVLGAQRLPPRPLTQHCHGLPPAWDPGVPAAFQSGGVLPCRAWLELGVKRVPRRAGGQEKAGTGRSLPLLCAAPAAPYMAPPTPQPEALLQPAGTRLPAAEPAVPRGARGAAAELASARGRGCFHRAQPLCFVNCSTNPSLTGR